MKTPIVKGNSAEIARAYPITGRLAGWFFRSTETSNNAWLVEGVDLSGRKVCRSGTDPEDVLALCIEDAKQIIHEVGAT